MDESPQETERILQTRAAMKQAGWEFAVPDTPGLYVPGPSLRPESQPTRWLVAPQTILQTVVVDCPDPALVAMLKDVLR
jgi:hypothetical protein